MFVMQFYLKHSVLPVQHCAYTKHAAISMLVKKPRFQNRNSWNLVEYGTSGKLNWLLLKQDIEHKVT